MKFKIIQLRKIWYTLSLTLVIVSLVGFGWLGLRWGVDFKGGSLLEVKFSGTRPAVTEVQPVLDALGKGAFEIQPIADSNLLLRFATVDETGHQEILKLLREKYGDLEERRFDSVGPVVGQDLRNKTIWGVIVAALGIILYISWAFRKVSKPVASWKFGVFAVIALLHDVIVVVGVFVFLGYFLDMEVNAPFVAALLTVFGYSVNDTIVVFDRIRENLGKRRGEDFETVVNDSINQTVVRSINTSLTVFLTLLAIFFWGGETIRSFALTLIVGIFFGTYSSIFLASCFLVTWQKLAGKYKWIK